MLFHFETQLNLAICVLNILSSENMKLSSLFVEFSMEVTQMSIWNNQKYQ